MNDPDISIEMANQTDARLRWVCTRCPAVGKYKWGRAAAEADAAEHVKQHGETKRALTLDDFQHCWLRILAWGIQRQMRQAGL